MTKNKEKEEHFICPVGRFFSEMDRLSKGGTEFRKHINMAKIEVLKAIRSLIDVRIQSLEEKSREKGKKKATKIEVQ